uniref:Uncharacterized protein n=1 Tax=Populus davidiana TaxID=266767 RepID=A0A6M2EUP7_9ROSI
MMVWIKNQVFAKLSTGLPLLGASLTSAQLANCQEEAEKDVISAELGPHGLRADLDLCFPQQQNLSFTSVYPLHGFILSVLVSGADHLFNDCLVCCSTMKRTAPQEYPSVIVVFMVDTPHLQPIFYHFFAIHTFRSTSGFCTMVAFMGLC